MHSNRPLACLALSLAFVAQFLNAQSNTNMPDHREWGKEVAGYELSISTVKTNYVSGEPVNLKISIKNVGTNSVIIAETYPASIYDASVTLANKTVLEPSLDLKKMRESSGSLSQQTCNPGGEAVSQLDYQLDKVYDLSRSGVYKVFLTRELLDTCGYNMRVPSIALGISPLKSAPPVKLVKVVSNVIEITVKPQPLHNN